MLHNRSYTTGHKSYRARATIELGNAIGWDNAHHVLYASVPDIAVGPRWYSTYEMGCNVVLNLLEGRDAELLAPGQPADAGRGGAAGRRHHAPARSVGHRGGRGAAARRAEPATDPRRHPGRRRPGHPRDGRAEQLLDVAARLRVLQHAGLVLRHLRASAPAQAPVRRRLVHQPRRRAPARHARQRPAHDHACRPAWPASARASCWSGSRRRLVALRSGRSRRSDRGVSRRPASTARRWYRRWPPPRARPATIRTTRSSVSARSRAT